MLGVSTADGAVRAVAGTAQTSASEKSLSLELGPHTYSSTPSSSPDGRARRAVEVAVALATPRDDVSVRSAPAVQFVEVLEGLRLPPAR